MQTSAGVAELRGEACGASEEAGTLTPHNGTADATATAAEPVPVTYEALNDVSTVSAWVATLTPPQQQRFHVLRVQFWSDITAHEAAVTANKVAIISVTCRSIVTDSVNTV